MTVVGCETKTEYPNEYIFANNDSVFYFNTSTNYFHLLYNFSAIENDIITVHNSLTELNDSPIYGSNTNIQSFEYQINSSSTTQISGVDLRTQTVNISNSEWSITFQEYEDAHIVEKIGSLTFYFGRYGAATTGERIGSLRCYSDNEISYNPSNLPDCEIVSNLNYEVESSILIIHPNPVTNTLKIEGADNSYQYSITNTLGIVVQTSYSDSINVSNLATGVYFLTIIKDGVSIEVRKFKKN